MSDSEGAEEGELQPIDFVDDYQFQRVTVEELRSKDIQEDYEVLHEVGSGTYGRVYKANSRSITNKNFALKQLDVSKEKDGFPITALREIKLLQKLNQENILNIKEIVTMRTGPREKGKQKITTFLVFDYMEHDFQGLIRKKQVFTRPQLKCVIQQLFKGLEYLHANNIIHRDLKSANLLLDKEGVLKIGDFGLARQIEKPLLRPLTSVVVTLWYRAPEILLGDKNYSFKSDVWSAGCFLAEMLLGEPLFTGKNEAAQIEQIYEKCGTPEPETWAGLTSFKFWKDFQPKKECKGSLIAYLKGKIPDIDSFTLDFLQALLTMNPEDRLDSKQALEHEFFEVEPLPCGLKDMPKIDQDCHFQPVRSQLNSQDHMPVPKQKSQPQNSNNNNNNNNNSNPRAYNNNKQQVYNSNAPNNYHNNSHDNHNNSYNNNHNGSYNNHNNHNNSYGNSNNNQRNNFNNNHGQNGGGYMNQNKRKHSYGQSNSKYEDPSKKQKKY